MSKKVNIEYSTLVTYITPNDEVEVIGASKAELAMLNFAPEWKEHVSEWGNFYTEIHPWAKAFDEMGDEHPLLHTRADGRKLRYNDLASKFFKQEIWGTCFIKPFSGKNADLGTALKRASGWSPSILHL